MTGFAADRRVPAAIALDRIEFPGKALFRRTVLLPLVLPGIITGISMLNLFRVIGFDLSLTTVIIGHGTALVSVVITQVFARLQRFNRRLEEASDDLGATPLQTFWLVAALPATLLLVFNAPFIAHDVTRPAITPQFLVTVGAVAGGFAAIIGGIVAFREVRRGQPAWTASGRAGWVLMAFIGVAVGAVATSILAGLASAGGVEITDAPTLTGVLTAEKTAFVETRLQMKDGEVLGLFVSNRDDIAHTFDIDSLDTHVDLPANSTTAIAIKPTGSGTLEFFCAVPGHREAGMVGTIDVNA